MIKLKELITCEELKKLFHYNSETGIFTRLTDVNRYKAGEIAGGISNGYVRISINKKSYLAHRLAWVYMTGGSPELFIDHKNCIRSDNRFCNLRQASFKENLKNYGIGISNSSGYKGVSYHIRDKSWHARCHENGKNHYLGRYNTPELASLAYQEFAKEHHGDFHHAN